MEVLPLDTGVLVGPVLGQIALSIAYLAERVLEVEGALFEE